MLILRPVPILASLLLAAPPLAVPAPAGPGAGADSSDSSIELRRATPFSVADLYFELNDTDGDLGLHALIDGEAWKLLELEGPNDRENLRVTVGSSLRQQGLTELFFESAEPPFDELPPEEFFARFPEGRWEVSATTLDGGELESSDRLSHVMPAPPENVLVSGIPAAASCDDLPLPVVAEPVVIDWDPVVSSHPEIGRSGSIQVVKYQLVVEREEPSALVLSVDLPPEVTEFELPEAFTALGDAFKFEILVRERSGNQTAIESCFELQ